MVKTICGSTRKREEDDPIADIPTDNTWEAAETLLKEVGVSSAALIEEIPLCWYNQVGIRFTLGKWDKEKNRDTFDLYAGVSKSNQNEFFFDMFVENDDGHFPVGPRPEEEDSDIGIHLFSDAWKIDGDRVIE